MTKEKSKALIASSMKRVKMSIFYLENDMIEEARKEMQKSWRQIISALLILNLYNKEEKQITHYSVPRSKIFSVSKSLEDKGLRDLVKISSVYFSSLQELPKSEIKVLIITLIKEEIEHIKEWFKIIWDEKLDEELNEIKKKVANG
ncbi:MAG: hypothetical protein QXY87_02255 [Saccharolobus sp.]|uniref:Uncharacterized protein n=3 Tax=Saccharolobus shibatae TaxID=2286 RepID=A0A8F5BLI1_SACSH|nr:hypothetical protein [Saccharolobus shibatae]MCH4814266.1 hypothetical protein [Saccharolobus shibatae]QXJ27326.1 hypothetical protein J5U23_00192 [Saccharolobus shibatae B12]QXJ30635.1 hypothetical protein J5U21_00283 [Saccharolobus shibatae]